VPFHRTVDAEYSFILDRAKEIRPIYEWLGILVEWQELGGFTSPDGNALRWVSPKPTVAYARAILPTVRGEGRIRIRWWGDGNTKLFIRDPRSPTHPHHDEYVLRPSTGPRVSWKEDEVRVTFPEDAEVFLYALVGEVDWVRVITGVKDRPAFRPILSHISPDIDRRYSGEWLDYSLSPYVPALTWLLAHVEECDSLVDGCRCNSRAYLVSVGEHGEDPGNAYAALAWGGMVGPPTRSFEVGYLPSAGGTEIRSLHWHCTVVPDGYARIKHYILSWASV